MRNWLDAILLFISSESLTDLEYAAINVLDLEVDLYNQEAYDQLAGVLLERESVSTQQDKLVAFFKAKGTDVAAVETGSSQIFIGAALCD